MADNAHVQQGEAANFRWNSVVNIVDATFFQFALNLVSQATIMPLLVSELAASKLAIGLIAAIWSTGFYLPQLLTANFTERLRFKKPFLMLISGLGERFPYLLMGLVVWLLAEAAPAVALAVFSLLLRISSVSSGVGKPGWVDRQSDPVTQTWPVVLPELRSGALLALWVREPRHLWCTEDGATI